MTVPWRVAKSLLQLRDQWKAAHPGAASPGFIGDDAHASRDSDHNPWVDDPASSLNVVTAGDFYHQPALGADAYALAEALKRAKDPRVKYVISRRRIWSLARDREGWRPYNGSNPHTGHTHVSVSSTKSRYDDTRPWNIGALTEKGGLSVSDVQRILDYQKACAEQIQNNTRQLVTAAAERILDYVETCTSHITENTRQIDATSDREVAAQLADLKAGVLDELKAFEAEAIKPPADPQ